MTEGINEREKYLVDRLHYLRSIPRGLKTFDEIMEIDKIRRELFDIRQIQPITNRF